MELSPFGQTPYFVSMNIILNFKNKKSKRIITRDNTFFS